MFAELKAPVSLSSRPVKRGDSWRCCKGEEAEEGGGENKALPLFACQVSIA